VSFAKTGTDHQRASEASGDQHLVSFAVDCPQVFSDPCSPDFLSLKKVYPLFRTFFRVVLASLCWFGAVRFAPAAEKPALERYEASASVMGSTFTVAGYGEQRARVASAIRAAFDEARRIDAFLSNYRPESELSRINDQASRGAVNLSAEMADLLEQCLRYSRQTEGGFDITVGPLMEVWGFFKGTGTLPGSFALSRARAKIGYRHLDLDAKERTVRFKRPGMKLDPGGIGKGYAVDRMLAVLRHWQVERAFISAGSSSLYALGAPPDEPRGWYVRIQHPKNHEIAAAEVYLKNQSLSTSGFYEKFFEAEGRIYSHIMDPRTGMPAEGVLTVSIISDETIDSEAWCKGYYVNGREWTAKHKRKDFRVFMCTSDDSCGWIDGPSSPN
jgi:thiamine biosynthesis lipoprotein